MDATAVDTAWTSLSEHLAGIRRYARRMARDPADADDLVQECLARALSRPHLWIGVRDVRAYLFAMLRHTHVDLAFRSRRDRDTVPLDDATLDVPCAATQPHALLMRDLNRCLDALPSERRHVLLLVGLEGMTYQEVADQVGIPIGTVMSRLSRGREALRRHMLDGESRVWPDDRCWAC